jgi:hypothetical protein
LNAVIMVNEPASRTDQGGIANRDALADIEFTTGADKDFVANPDTGLITPNSIMFENDPVFDQTSSPQRHFMRPGNSRGGHDGAPSDDHTPHPQDWVEERFPVQPT